jgi:hypothetical protein
MKHLNVWIVASVLLMLSGCGMIPTQNTSNKPMSIKADGEQYFTCKSFTLESDHSFAGETAYNLGFTQAGTSLQVSLKGIRKLEMREMPTMVDGPMPFPLPDVKNDKDGSGQPYQEGSIYHFSGGEDAQVKNGRWIAVKVPNSVCKMEQQ